MGTGSSIDTVELHRVVGDDGWTLLLLESNGKYAAVFDRYYYQQWHISFRDVVEFVKYISIDRSWTPPQVRPMRKFFREYIGEDAWTMAVLANL